MGDIRYELTLSLPEAMDQPIAGRTVLRFSLADATRPLVLDSDPDMQAIQLTSYGAVTRSGLINGHLVVPASVLRRGQNTVEIDFIAADARCSAFDPEIVEFGGSTVTLPPRAASH